MQRVPRCHCVSVGCACGGANTFFGGGVLQNFLPFILSVGLSSCCYLPAGVDRFHLLHFLPLLLLQLLLPCSVVCVCAMCMQCMRACSVVCVCIMCTVHAVWCACALCARTHACVHAPHAVHACVHACTRTWVRGSGFACVPEAGLLAASCRTSFRTLAALAAACYA